jgi:hypothetical protein
MLKNNEGVEKDPKVAWDKANNEIRFLAADVLREAGLAGANEKVQSAYLAEVQSKAHNSGVGLTGPEKKYLEAIKNKVPNPNYRTPMDPSKI